MTILTCKQSFECISLQILKNNNNDNNNPILKTTGLHQHPHLPTFKAYPTPEVVVGSISFFAKMRGKDEPKVPGAILPLGCAFLSTGAKTVWGLLQPPPPLEN